MTDSDLPLALYKANLDLWLRLGELLQDNREQWMQLLAREVHDNVVEAQAEIEQAQQAEGWQSLSVLPGSALWRIAQQQIGDLQALMQTAVGNQLTFANGFHNALAQWQEATAGAIGGAGDVPQLGDLMEHALQTISALAPGAGATSAAAAARPRDASAASPARRQRAAQPAAAGAGTPPRKRATGARASKSAATRRSAAAKSTKQSTKRAAGKAGGAVKPAKKAARKTTTKTVKASKKQAAKRATRKAASKRSGRKSAS